MLHPKHERGFLFQLIFHEIKLTFFLCFGFEVEVCAVLKLDNCYVGQSMWKPLGTECWTQQFHIDLDKVLQVGTKWHCCVYCIFQFVNVALM